MLSGWLIFGQQGRKFEIDFSKYLGKLHGVLTNSGSSANLLMVTATKSRKFAKQLKDGDKIITPVVCFPTTINPIIQNNLTPVFVDVLPDQNIDPSKIEAAITEKTKAIMPVHLTGRMCDMDPIMDIANKYDLVVIEDAAQSVGSKYKGKPSGSIGDVGCFSTHPLKNLNACGDGGFLTTNNESIFNKSKLYRNHGMADRNIVDHFGSVTRMDNLQAAILNYRLGKLEFVIQKRRNNANSYFEGIKMAGMYIPEEKTYEYNTYHTFVVQTEHRDKLKEYLFSNGIDTAIHYPIPIHLQPASKKLGYKEGDFPITEKQSKQILTLPINQFLSGVDLEKIVDVINKFEKR